MIIIGYNHQNKVNKAIDAINSGENDIAIKTLSSSDSIKKLDLLGEYMKGMYIPMIWNRRLGMGIDAHNNKSIDRKVIWGNLYTFEEFLAYIETPSDLRTVFQIGIDINKKPICSLNGLKIFNYD